MRVRNDWLCLYYGGKSYVSFVCACYFCFDIACLFQVLGSNKKCYSFPVFQENRFGPGNINPPWQSVEIDSHLARRRNGNWMLKRAKIFCDFLKVAVRWLYLGSTTTVLAWVVRPGILCHFVPVNTFVYSFTYVVDQIAEHSQISAHCPEIERI